MSQTAFIDTLTTIANLNDSNTAKTPYRSGLPVDKLEPPDKPATPDLILQMQQLVGSLQWLSQSTRPDIATITNILVQYQSNPSPQHIDSAKRVIQYLKGTSTMGIRFQQQPSSSISGYLNFPIDHKEPMGLTDANWGPQDQSKTSPTSFKT